MQRTCDSVVAYGVVTGERTVVYHSPYGIQQGTKTIVVRAVDMDVVVILVCLFVCVRARAHECSCEYVRACVYACVRSSMCVCVFVFVCSCALTNMPFKWYLPFSGICIVCHSIL